MPCEGFLRSGAAALKAKPHGPAGGVVVTAATFEPISYRCALEQERSPKLLRQGRARQPGQGGHPRRSSHT
ncbi:hypothetical protein GN956_G19588 [Arapaima gigas]